MRSLAPAVVLLQIVAAGLEAESGPPATVPVHQLATVSVDPPAAPGSLAPRLGVAAGQLAATWLEPYEMTAPQPAGAIGSGEAVVGHRLRFARLGPAGWSEPSTVAQGTDFFANWADLPAFVEAGDGTLYAHWLAKTGTDTYAYSIFLARSTDGGRIWRALGRLNSDSTPTEHGFVAFVPEADGARAFWLDGREMLAGEPMSLRTAAIGVSPEEGVGPETVLDDRVCECCATDAALAVDGPMVVYRDRGDSEIRDIAFVRGTGGSWTPPALVARDGWRIEGCPVNGPKIASDGSRAAVAWFTSAGDGARVQVAFSSDGGASFDAPQLVEEGQVLGRVDVALDEEDGAWVSWVARGADQAEIRLQHFSAAGRPAERGRVARTRAARASGFPVLERLGGQLYLAWVDIESSVRSSRIRVVRLAPADLESSNEVR